MTSDFGARVRWLRRQKGWTQKVLADQAGVAHVTISRYEREKHTPQRLDIVEKIAEVLEVSPGVLRGRDPLPGAAGEGSVRPGHTEAAADFLVASRPDPGDDPPGIDWYKTVMERLAVALEESARAQHQNGLANRIAQENIRTMLHRDQNESSPHGTAGQDAEVGAVAE